LRALPGIEPLADPSRTRWTLILRRNHDRYRHRSQYTDTLDELDFDFEFSVDTEIVDKDATPDI
jgi:hypothetical protein